MTRHIILVGEQTNVVANQRLDTVTNCRMALNNNDNNGNNNGGNGMRVGYIVDGSNEMQVFVLADQAANISWSNGWRNIKDVIANINEQAVERRNPLYLRWLEMADGFRIQWGNELVPADIRKAVNDVQEGLNLPKTEW